MIISQFWLPESTRESGATVSEEFYALVTNLEAVPLRFQFVFVATQTHWPNHDSTEWLRLRVKLHGGGGDVPAVQAKIHDWTRVSGRYRASCELGIAAGHTDHAGLRFQPPTDAETPIQSTILQWPRALRGHWELRLPAVPAGPSTSAQPKPQLDHDARVLVTPLRRLVRRSADAKLSLHELSPLPLASGKSEHLITPDHVLTTIVATEVAVASKRRVARPHG